MAKRNFTSTIVGIDDPRHPVAERLALLSGRRFKIVYQQAGRWHQKYADRDGVEAALEDARKVDSNAYAVQTS